MQFQNNLILKFREKFPNISTREAAAASQIYIELCEVKKYWDIEYVYNDDLRLLYFVAKLTKSADPSIFLPFCASDGLTFNQMEHYFKLSNRLFLAIIGNDCTCVFYEILNGLNLPTDDTLVKHLNFNRHKQLDANIRNNSNTLGEAALCGIPLTLNLKK